jgi:hypothetical protein
MFPAVKHIFHTNFEANLIRWIEVIYIDIYVMHAN